MPSRLRVLIGDDDPVVAQGLRAQVEGLGHTVPGVAHDGRDAVAKAEALTPDLILLDIKMPHLDGVQATTEIMARRPVPIILVTAYSDPELIQRALVAGVMGYLIKPIDRKDLAPALALAMSRFGDLMALRRDARSLKEALALRQQVERAKGILAQRMGLPEAEAHKRLQALARRERCTLGEAAGRVITADRFYTDLEDVH